MINHKINEMGVIRIIGVDPGTNYTGVAILTLSLPTLTIINIETMLMDMFGLENKQIIHSLEQYN